jgi:hypothetical protein
MYVIDGKTGLNIYPSDLEVAKEPGVVGEGTRFKDCFICQKEIGESPPNNPSSC